MPAKRLDCWDDAGSGGVMPVINFLKNMLIPCAGPKNVAKTPLYSNILHSYRLNSKNKNSVRNIL
jgi:hypothetical protein